jgi:hypothetical protein
MKKLLLAVALSPMAALLWAQDFQVPEDYVFEKAEDYKPYEDDVVGCVDWLVETPLFQNPSKREKANALLLKWLMGSPYVHIEINPVIVSFAGTSPDMLMVFMGGWARHSITTKEYEDKVAGNVAGLEAVIGFYNTNKGLLPRDKNIEKYAKLKKKDKLREFVEKQL